MVAHVYFERNVGVKGNALFTNYVVYKSLYFGQGVYFVKGHGKLMLKATRTFSSWGRESNAPIFTA